METAPLREIKRELKILSQPELLEIITRLARFKKENKELLSYLLFDSINQQEFIKNVKSELDEQFEHLNIHNLFQARKTLRKILRNLKKYIRFSVSREVELELLIYFCRRMRHSGLRMNSHPAVMNMYHSQVKLIKRIALIIHEDLRSDFEEEIAHL